MATRTIWRYRMIFALLCALFVFFALLPFGDDGDSLPGPDLVFCLAAAWILRRPDYVPVWLLVGLLLLGDVLLMRPLGLWTLILLLTSEYLRRRVDYTEALPFGSEIALVARCVLVAFVADHLVLMLLLAQTPPLLGQGVHALATIAFYPPIAIFSQLIGVRRLAPGELDSLGTRA